MSLSCIYNPIPVHTQAGLLRHFSRYHDKHEGNEVLKCVIYREQIKSYRHLILLLEGEELWNTYLHKLARLSIFREVYVQKHLRLPKRTRNMCRAKIRHQYVCVCVINGLSKVSWPRPATLYQGRLEPFCCLWPNFQNFASSFLEIQVKNWRKKIKKYIVMPPWTGLGRPCQEPACPSPY